MAHTRAFSEKKTMVFRQLQEGIKHNLRPYTEDTSGYDGEAYGASEGSRTEFR